MIFFGKSPACSIGLHQTILSHPSGRAIPVVAEISPFQKSNGSTSIRALCQGQDLVRMSAGLSIDGMCSKRMKPPAMASQTLWYDNAFHHLFKEECGIVELVTTDLLSPNSHEAPSSGTSNMRSM